MKFDGSSGIGTGVKAAGFGDYDYSSLDATKDDMKKTKFDNFPGGLFTMPNPSGIAFNHSTGGRDDGAFNA